MSTDTNPIVMNSIAEIVKRGDLMDRAITIELDHVSEEARRTEADVDATFRTVQPAILAALADAVSQALRVPVTLKAYPRMADFAKTVESAAPALGWESKSFLALYAESRDAASEAMVEGDLIVDALKALQGTLQHGKTWTGSSTQLYDYIRSITPVDKLKVLPQSSQLLVGRLKRLAPTLRLIGIDVTPPKVERVSSGGTARVMRVTYTERQPTLLQFRRDEAVEDKK